MGEQLFADNGVMAIEHADFEGIERLALVLGGEITSTFDSPETVRLGECKSIEEVMIGEDKLLKFSGVKLGEACTVVLRGATQQILDEADRSLHDTLCVLTQTVKETRTVYGGGCSEVLMAGKVMELAVATEGKKLWPSRLSPTRFSKSPPSSPTTPATTPPISSPESEPNTLEVAPRAVWTWSVARWATRSSWASPR